MVLNLFVAPKQDKKRRWAYVITVKVKDLEEMVKELQADGIEYVGVSVLESEVFDGEVIPATLHFEGYDGTGGGIDYEGIEEVKIDACYKIWSEN